MSLSPRIVRTTRPGILALAGLAAVVLATGCDVDDGGGDETTGTAATAESTVGTAETPATGPPLTKPQFIKRADAICAPGNKKIATEGRAIAKGTKNQQALKAERQRFGTQVVAPTIQDQIDQIESLSAPKSNEKQLGQFLESLQDGVDEIHEDPSSMAQEGGPDAFGRAARIGRQYGFKVCGGS